MLTQSFQKELIALRRLAREFGMAHPAIAPRLAESTSDPDVDRLFEGVAFLSALVRQKIDDTFPEIVHELIQLIWPGYLNPVPSFTMMALNPAPTVSAPAVVPAGTFIDSEPVNGTVCRYRTCCDVALHPLRITAAGYQDATGGRPCVRIDFNLDNLRLQDWSVDCLRLYLNGDVHRTTGLYLTLLEKLQRIVVQTPDGEPCVLGPASCTAGDLNGQESLVPCPSQAFPGHRLIREYFLLPEKFLFVDVRGWEQWKERGEGATFSLIFELDGAQAMAADIGPEDLKLFVTPAANLFPMDAAPITVDHTKYAYRVKPAAAAEDHYQVVSVEQVTGYRHADGQQRVYRTMGGFENDSKRPVFSDMRKKSPVMDRIDFHLAVAHGSKTVPESDETLSIELLCSNGRLPDALGIGDVHRHTHNAPEYASFSNITRPTADILPPLDTNDVWRLVSMLTLNINGLKSADSLKSLLRLFAGGNRRDKAIAMAHEKRIDAIQSVSLKSANKLASGIMLSGRDIVVDIRQDGFSGMGDVYLFGTVLERFFGMYAPLNTFTRLTINEPMTGETFRWPARMNDRILI